MTIAAFSSTTAFLWVEKTLSIALFLQSIEFLKLRKLMKDDSIWSWNILKLEFQIFPNIVQKVLDFFLGYPNVVILIGIQLALSIGLIFFSDPVLIWLLFLSTTLLSLRWRGTFNGGSDFMTLLILMSLGLAGAFRGHPLAQDLALGYIGIQTCTSYFVSGFIKLKKMNWRNGKALQGFIRASIYNSTHFTETFRRAPRAHVFSWAVMLFEVSFPLTLLNSWLCLCWIGVAVIFHLGNFYLFGLNRFIFAWGAAYPALIWCSLKLSR